MGNCKSQLMGKAAPLLADAYIVEMDFSNGAKEFARLQYEGKN